MENPHMRIQAPVGLLCTPPSIDVPRFLTQSSPWLSFETGPAVARLLRHVGEDA